MVKEIFVQYYTTRDVALRDQILEENMKLVKYIARKFMNRGEPLEDVIQVGVMGLMKAVDRFDPTQQIEFATYATPTIVGEIKHFFRDKSHLVKIPRRLHELYSRIKKAIYDFNTEVGRSPTISEIADAVGVTEEEVLESLEAGQAHSTVSLDVPTYSSERSGGQSESKTSLLDCIKEESVVQDKVIDRENLRYAITKALSRREQRIVYLRFYDNLSQSEIAQLLNLSQMHVSRLLAHSLKKLKKYVQA